MAQCGAIVETDFGLTLLIRRLLARMAPLFQAKKDQEGRDHDAAEKVQFRPAEPWREERIRESIRKNGGHQETERNHKVMFHFMTFA